MIDEDNAEMQQLECKMLKQMTACCAKTERCIRDIENKLNRTALDARAISRIIQFLVENNYIDEARFARCFANDKLRFNHWGRNLIGAELRKRNIPADCIREAIDRIDDIESAEILSKLLKGKSKRVKRSGKEPLVAQLINYALSRGYSLREAEAAISLTGLKSDDYEPPYLHDMD